MSSVFSYSLDRRSFLRTALAGSCAAAIAGCRSANQIPRPLAAAEHAGKVNSSPGAAIDTHIHVVHGNPDLKPIPEEMEKLTASAPEVKARRLKMEMDQANVAVAFAMGHRDGARGDPLGLESTLEVAKLIPGLRVIGIADPRRASQSHLKAVEHQIQRQRDRIVAFKAYLGYLPFEPAHRNYRPYYKLAAKYDLPFIFHTGDVWSFKGKAKYAHPLLVDEVAVEHPDVRFVLAHFGNPWLIDAAEVVFKNNNVWADLSGLYVGTEDSIAELLRREPLPDVASGVMIAELKKAFGYSERYDRLLYASDWPLTPMAVYRRFIEAIIPNEHHPKVFRANAEQLFRIE